MYAAAMAPKVAKRTIAKKRPPPFNAFRPASDAIVEETAKKRPPPFNVFRPASDAIVEETDKTGIVEVATTNNTGEEAATTDQTGIAEEAATDKTGIAGDPDKAAQETGTKFDDTDSDMYWSPHAPDW